MIHTDGIQTIANAERRVGDRRKRGIHEAMGETLYAEQDASLGHSVLATPPGYTPEAWAYEQSTREPQSPQEARLNAALDGALDFAAFRAFDTLRERLTPMVVSQTIDAEGILGVVTILADEYRERYEAHRGR